MSLSMQCRLARGDFAIDVDLCIPSGCVIGVAGENGAGKTTTLDLIAGLLPCSSGTIAIDDTVVDDSSRNVFVQPEHRATATVFQGSGLIPHFSVERNVTLGRGRSLRSSARFDDIVDAFDLRPLLDRRPSGLSGGQRQRVSLARAFLSPSRIMLLDEPTTYLDTQSRRVVRGMLKESFATYDGVVVLVSHDPNELEELSDDALQVELTRGATTSALLTNR